MYLALNGARKLNSAIISLELKAQTFLILPCQNGPFLKINLCGCCSTNQKACISGKIE